MAKYRICDQCEAPNDIHAKICTKCGARIDNSCEIVEIKDLDAYMKDLEQENKEEETSEVNKQSGDMIECPFCHALNEADELICTECNQPLDKNIGNQPKATSSTCCKKEETCILKDQFEEKNLVFSNNYIYLGRNHNCFSNMNSNGYISGLHCVLWKIDNKYYLQDVSSNGTTLNGKKLNRGEVNEIKNGDSFALYTYIIKFILK